MPTVLYQGETAFYSFTSEVEVSQRKYNALVVVTDRRIVIELGPLQTMIVWMGNIGSVSVDKARHILKPEEDVLVLGDSQANVVYRITPLQGQGVSVHEVADRIMNVARLLKTPPEKGAVVTDAQWAQLHENYESRIRTMSSNIVELTEEVRRLTEEATGLRKELKTAHGKIQALEVELETEKKSKQDLLELYRKRLEATHDSQLRSKMGFDISEPTSADLQAVDDKRFEEFVAEIFQKMGYVNVEVVGGPGDHNVDITAEKKDEFDHVERWVIQCKRYKQDTKVGGPAILQLATAAEHHHKRAIPCFVTSSDFTDDAREQAKALKVRLINGVQLLERAKKHGVAVPAMRTI